MRGCLVRCSGSELCGEGRSAPLGLCVGQLASAPGAQPPEVSHVGTLLGSQVWEASWGFIVGPQSTNLRARNRASGERRGCLSRFHSPVAEGGGAPEAVAAAESSLSSP